MDATRRLSASGRSKALTMMVTSRSRSVPVPATALDDWVVSGLVLGRVFRRCGDGDLLALALAAEADRDLVVVLAVDDDRHARLQVRAEHEVGERVLDVALDGAAQRSCAHRRVVALLDEQLLGAGGEL